MIKNIIHMTYSALSYHQQLPYKLLILKSTHNTRRSFRSENTSEGIWSILFHCRSLEGRKETKYSVSLFFRFVVAEKEIYLLMCWLVFRKPYFLAKTAGSMELVWKKNNGPQHPTIDATVALLAIYSTYRCIRCTLGWFFQEKWVIYLTLEFGVKYPVQSFSTFEMFWSVNQQLPNHGANLASLAWGLFSWQSIQKEKRIVKHTRGKKLRCDRKLWSLSLLTGMNRLQEKRNVSLISVCMG